MSLEQFERRKKSQKDYEDGYDDGLIKGSEVGDATAKRALKERDDDMSRFQNDRLEWVKERDSLRTQLEAMTQSREHWRQHEIEAFARNAALTAEKNKFDQEEIRKERK